MKKTPCISFLVMTAFVLSSCDEGSAPQGDAVTDETSDCGEGRVTCGSLCVDLLTDRNNCGGCGSVCRPFEVCQNGGCMIECPAEQIDCGGECVNIDSDLANCGGCGRTCAAGTHALEAVCELGVCTVVCEAGWTDEELYDALNVALIVGGSIVIPHLRHAVETIDILRAEKQE